MLVLSHPLKLRKLVHAAKRLQRGMHPSAE